MWSPKHSSFVCRLNEYRAPHSHRFRRPPAASSPVARRKPTAAPTAFRRKNCLRRNAAALGGVQRPRRGCGVVAEQRRRGGRQGRRPPGPQIREGARHRGLPDLGTSEGCSGIETYAFSGNDWQSCVFPLLNRCDMPSVENG